MADAEARPSPPMSHGSGASAPLVNEPRKTTHARRSIFEVAVDRVWRSFCSVRAAIWEIAFLAVLVLIGTLRGSDAPQWLANALPFTQGFVDHWYAWDVFSSLIFALNVALVAVAILIGGMINRAPGIWKTITDPTVTTTYGFLRSTTPSSTARGARTPTELTAAITDALRAHRYRVLTAERGAETHLYADRNRWGKLGTFPFHLGLILVMIGALMAGRLGFREVEFIVPEGHVVAVGHGTDLAVELNSFNDSYYLDGTPQDYVSHITFYDGDDPVKSGDVRVNQPLSHDGVTVYQTSFGTTVDLRVTDDNGNVVHEGPITMGLYHSRQNPDAPAGRIRLDQAGVTLNVIGPDRNPWNEPERDLLQLGTAQVYVQVAPDAIMPNVDPPAAILDLNNGAALGNINVEFLGYGRFALFQVARNPSIPIFVVASIFLIGGLLATFYLPHRRIRGIVGPRPGGGSQAELAPLARRDWSGRRDFIRLMTEARERLDVEVTITSDDQDLRPTVHGDNQSPSSGP